MTEPTLVIDAMTVLGVAALTLTLMGVWFFVLPGGPESQTEQAIFRLLGATALGCLSALAIVSAIAK